MSQSLEEKEYATIIIKDQRNMALKVVKDGRVPLVEAFSLSSNYEL